MGQSGALGEHTEIPQFAAVSPPGQDSPPPWLVPAGPGRGSAAAEEGQRLLQQQLRTSWTETGTARPACALCRKEVYLLTPPSSPLPHQVKEITVHEAAEGKEDGSGDG